MDKDDVAQIIKLIGTDRDLQRAIAEQLPRLNPIKDVIIDIMHTALREDYRIRAAVKQMS